MINEIQKAAIEAVRREKLNYQDNTVFVTDKVGFAINNLIRLLRKNYWGIYDQPYDQVTGRKKVWVHLTQTHVDNVVKNIDLDAKDVNFRANRPSAIAKAIIVRNVVKKRLEQMFFGEKLDQMERDLCIDGTVVWKTYKTDGEVKLKQVDLLNVFIDPTAPSIQQAYRFTERALMSVDEIKGMNGWINTDLVKVQSENLSRSDDRLNSTSNVTPTGKYVDVYEMWGKIPKYWITGNESDKEEIDGHIVVSGLDSKGNSLCHLVEENKKGIKPYEEAWYVKVNNRWYGVGIAEKLMMLQWWLNTIVNLRINASYVRSLGLFKIRRGSNITPQMLASLPSSGAIVVESMDDIEDFAVSNSSQMIAEGDEASIEKYAQALTSAYESVTGEQMPSSTPATNAVIQKQSASSQFVLVKKQIGMFLQRWVKRQYLPLVLPTVKKDEYISIFADSAELRDLVTKIANKVVAEEVNRMNAMGVVVNPQEIYDERDRIVAQLQANKELFVAVKDKIGVDDDEVDVSVQVTNEDMDKGIMLQNLLTALQLAPEYKEGILRTIFDSMGMDMPAIENRPQMQPLQPEQQGMEQPGMPQIPTQNPQEQFTQANV